MIITIKTIKTITAINPTTGRPSLLAAELSTYPVQCMLVEPNIFAFRRPSDRLLGRFAGIFGDLR